MACYFCKSTEIEVLKTGYSKSPSFYRCARCGDVSLDEEAAADIPGERFGPDELKNISICLRKEFERRGRKPPPKKLRLGDLHHMADQYHPLGPLEKMDEALFNLEKATPYLGSAFSVDIRVDYPNYHCTSQMELVNILKFLHGDGLLGTKDPDNPFMALWIAPKGYKRLRELRKQKDSRQCFVAMWFDDSMNRVYKEAIEPAIEYIERGETEPRFRALRIDNKEHTNDINDEVISEIRRSKFMVCDLTGYRGGVYFEAGFAYGLRLDVIYTCHEDWIKSQHTLIVDKDGAELDIVREGIHFDLEHRSRIPWTEDGDGLSEFKKKLTDKIKAVII